MFPRQFVGFFARLYVGRRKCYWNNCPWTWKKKCIMGQGRTFVVFRVGLIWRRIQPLLQNEYDSVVNPPSLLEWVNKERQQNEAVDQCDCFVAVTVECTNKRGHTSPRLCSRVPPCWILCKFRVTTHQTETHTGTLSTADTEQKREEDTFAIWQLH